MKRTWRMVGRGLIAVGMVLAMLPVLGMVAGAENNVANPDLDGACGLDVALVLDRSGSIADADAEDEVAGAAQEVIDALEGTGGLVKVVTFASTADGLDGSGSQTSDLAQIVFNDPADIDLPDAGFPSSGSTNWDDALEVVRRSSGGVPPLVVMITDGQPTSKNSGAEDDGNTEDGHGNAVDTDGSGSSTSADEIGEAQDEADALQDAGAHVFVVGVGAALQSATNVGRIESISGGDLLEGDDETLGTADDVPFGQADYTLVDEFDQLATLMRSVVIELCAPSLNLRKLFDPLQGPTTPVDDWSFGLEVEDYAPGSWTSPGVADGTTQVALQTEVDGFANFKWEPPDGSPLASTDLVITESLPPGVAFGSVECTRNSFLGNPPDALDEDVTVDGSQVSIRLDGDSRIGPEQSINCTITNREVAPASILIDKNTVPAGLAQGFDFTLTGEGVSDSIDDLAHADPAQAFDPVLPGTYTVAEDDEDGFTPGSQTCDLQGTVPDEAASPVDLTVDEGETWLCTFVNEAEPGSVTIVKQADGADGEFDFTGSFGPFSIQTNDGSGQQVFDGLSVGDYSVSESDPDPWDLVGASCDDGSDVTDIEVGPGEDVTCTFTNEAPLPTIDVTKNAQVGAVAEPGGLVTFDVSVTNTSVESLTITSLTDEVGGITYDITDLGDVVATTCSVPQSLGIGSTYDCSFTLDVNGGGGDVVTDTVTAVAEDDDENQATDTAQDSVQVTDVLPSILVEKTADPLSIDENGAAVTYTVEVTNTTSEALDITSMTDSVEGGPGFDITTVAGDVVATDCGALTSIGANGSASCAFTVFVDVDYDDTLPDGDVDDTVSVTAQDDDDNQVTETAAAQVGVNNVRPVIEVTKTATTSEITEAGGPAVFELTIENTSTEEAAIVSIVDSIEGGPDIDVTQVGGPISATTCDLIGNVLAPSGSPGDSITCSFTVESDAIDVAGLDDGDLDDVVTVTVEDLDDGFDVSASDSASVPVIDVRPTINVEKTADPLSIDEPGGSVTYSVLITNTSLEPVTITAVSDALEIRDAGDNLVQSVPSTAVGTCTDLVGDSLDPGESASCQFILTHDAVDAGWTIEDVVSVSVVDNDSDDPVTETDDAVVVVDDVLPTVTVTKVADVGSLPEPGGDVTYTVTVVNTSIEPVEITSLSDEPAFPADGCLPDLIGEVLLAGDGFAGGGDTVSCTFTAATGVVNAGDDVSDTVTVVVEDNEGNEASDSATETVPITDVSPQIDVVKEVVDGETPIVDPEIPEPGAPVTYRVTITNPTFETLTITSIGDVFDGEALPNSDFGTCPSLDGTSIAPGDSTTCTYTVEVAGNAGDVVDNEVTVAVEDDDPDDPDNGPDATDSDTESVEITDVAPVIDVTKVAVDGPGGDPIAAPSVDEPGADVRFRVTVANESDDPVTITSITDYIDSVSPANAIPDGEFGDCPSLVGEVIAAGDSVSCEFVDFVGGNPADGQTSVTDIVVVEGEDDDPDDPDNGPDVVDSDTETVEIDDVLPTATLDKDPAVDSVPEPGDEVSFSVTVANTSTEALTLTSLVDEVDGQIIDVLGPDLSPEVVSSTCTAGVTVPAGASYECEFVLEVTGNAGDTVADTLTATLEDDEGNQTEPSDAEEVDIDDVLPSIEVDKDNGDAVLSAPGGSVDFVVTVTNTSVEPVQITEIVDIIDGQVIDVTAVGGDVTATDCATGGTIPVDGAYTCTFTLSIESDEQLTEVDQVEVTVVDDEGNEADDSDTATTEVGAVADLAIDKASIGDFVVGDPGVYSIVVTNGGPSTAVGVEIVDVLPEGLTPTAALGQGWVCDIDGQTVSCSTPLLAPGEDSAVTVVVDIDAGLIGEDVTNVAEVGSDTDDNDETNNTDDDTTTIIEAPTVLPDVITRPAAPGPLPTTGAQLRAMAIVSLLCVAVGTGILGLSRRRASRVGDVG